MELVWRYVVLRVKGRREIAVYAREKDAVLHRDMLNRLHGGGYAVREMQKEL